MPQAVVIYTIGHSDHTTETFLDLLRRHAVTLIVDVRSQPYSRWTPQFNRETLERDLQNESIGYRFMGDTLGGRPSGPGLYSNGKPDYERMEQVPAYQSAVDRLLDLGQAERVGVMCSEGDHRQCHRHLLITQALLKRGARVIHIQPNGQTVEGEREAEQLSLF